jgi:indole-3-glycerol phosphate synthase
MNAVLNRIVSRTRLDLVRKRTMVPLADMERKARRAPPPRPFAQALMAGGVSLIAELKAKSPSAGLIRPRYNVAKGARSYTQGGARALSILTEPFFFGGRLEHLALARAASPLPVLRKDFIVDSYQVVESRAGGADAILLIVRLLTDWELITLQRLAWDWNMDVLVETHNTEDMDRAKKAGARLVGVNSRDLDTLKMARHAFERLVPRAPKGAVVVAESGIKTPADVERLTFLGVNAMLVGESLLKQKDLESAARTLAAAGKRGIK